MIDPMTRLRPLPWISQRPHRPWRGGTSRGFGFADVEMLEPARPVSRFRIAGVSKPFTATAVMYLVKKANSNSTPRVSDS